MDKINRGLRKDSHCQWQDSCLESIWPAKPFPDWIIIKRVVEEWRLSIFDLIFKGAFSMLSAVYKTESAC